MTLKNKNSLSTHQAKRFFKVAKLLQISPLLLPQNLQQFSRLDELNRFIRTKDFLTISKGYLSKASTQAILSTYHSPESVDCFKVSTGDTFKFYVDTTGNNN